MLLVNVNRGSCTNATVVPNVSVQQVGCGARGQRLMIIMWCGERVLGGVWSGVGVLGTWGKEDMPAEWSHA